MSCFSYVSWDLKILFRGFSGLKILIKTVLPFHLLYPITRKTVLAGVTVYVNLNNKPLTFAPFCSGHMPLKAFCYICSTSQKKKNCRSPQCCVEVDSVHMQTCSCQHISPHCRAVMVHRRKLNVILWPFNKVKEKRKKKVPCIVKKRLHTYTMATTSSCTKMSVQAGGNEP